MAFIIYKKAFDSVEHTFVLQALKNRGFQDNYIRKIKNIYNYSYEKIKWSPREEIKAGKRSQER
jgi:hypothetical protein